MNRLEKIEDPLEKYLFLVSLQDRNETLFYKIVIDNMPMMGSIELTLACLRSAQWG
jgi:malate dehydrogenase (oxaloacetate-decarboxylating)(NADP+)